MEVFILLHWDSGPYYLKATLAFRKMAGNIDTIYLNISLCSTVQ